MASSSMPSLAGSTTPLNSLRQIPLHHCQVSRLVNSNMKMTEIERRALCVASMGVRVNARFTSSRGGADVLEKPTFNLPQFEPSTTVQEGGDIGRLRDKRGTGRGDSYRVLLLDDERHTENLVAKVLPQAVPSVTPDDARRLFRESRQNGVAVVIVTVKEHAEFYSQMMIRGGLRSSIEPESNV